MSRESDSTLWWLICVYTNDLPVSPGPDSPHSPNTSVSSPTGRVRTRKESFVDIDSLKLQHIPVGSIPVRPLSTLLSYTPPASCAVTTNPFRPRTVSVRVHPLRYHRSRRRLTSPYSMESGEDGQPNRAPKYLPSDVTENLTECSWVSE